MKGLDARRKRAVSRTCLGGAAAALFFSAGVLAGQPPADDKPSLVAWSTASSSMPGTSRAVDDPLTAGPRTVAPDAAGRFMTIVRFIDQPLASYEGDVPGLRATSNRITGASRLDARSPAARSYLRYLEQRQASHAAEMARLLLRPIELEFQYLGALNGAAVRLTIDEARKIRDLDFVIDVRLDEERDLQTDVGPEHIGAPSIWNGQTIGTIATRGEGIVVGIIDSGINASHPSFAATDGDGYAHTNPYGAGVYRGWCVSNSGFCNEKLIAAYSFNPVGVSPADTDNHGSHVAATAAGNRHLADFSVGGDDYSLDISGVAPRANIVAYKVCNPSCPTSASIAAINSAIVNDEVDVLNYSISGNDFPWDDAVDLAFLDAFNAGIFIAASAGNAGPGAGTVAKTGPWMSAVAASTHRRVIGNTLDVTGPTTPASLQDVLAVPGGDIVIGSDIEGELRFSVDNPLGCTSYPVGFFSGAIALISRGGCTFSQKIDNAVAAGATNVVVFNNAGGPPITMGGVADGRPPSVMIDSISGNALRDYVLANPAATIRLNAGTLLINDEAWQDVMGAFSARGPSQYDLLAPTFTAPGVNILAAGFDGPGAYTFLQGTSMSSPHVAGSGALLKGLRPGWTPAEMRAALALTATPDLLSKEDGSTPADPFDQGSGLLDLAAAGRAGLVMNETHGNFLAANPALGGQPRDLNIPHLVDQNCVAQCVFERRFSSVSPVAIDYVVQSSAPVGISVITTPSAFTLAPGANFDLVVEVTVDTGTAQLDAWNFGEIRIEPQSPDVATARLPLALVPQAPTPVIEVLPELIQESGDFGGAPVLVSLQVNSNGSGDLVWEIDSVSVLEVPVWDQPRSGTGGIVSDFFIGSNAGAYAAADFVLGGPTMLTSIFAEGFDNFNSLAAQPLINWHVYADEGGVPAGHPEDGTNGVSALWTYSAAPNATGVDISGNNIALDLKAVSEEINLPAGTYWLSVFPSYDVTGADGARWNWYQADQVGAQAQLISPGIFGVADWTSLSALGVSFNDTAFSLIAERPCGASWMSLEPGSGTLVGGAGQTLSLVLNPAGLDRGTYSASVCILSNDPLNPLMTVPVTFTVLDFEVFSDRFESP